MIKLVVVDEHPVVVKGLEAFFKNSRNTKVVGHLKQSKAVLDYIKTHQVDILLTEINLEDVNGITLIKRVKRHHPEVKIIVFTNEAETIYGANVIKSGASGFVSKTQDLKDLDGWCYLGGKMIQCSDIKEEDKDKTYPVKDVFRTFKEINQMDLVKQAGVRQQYIDQGVSLNLAFPSIASPKWINQVTMEAWKQGIKTLYYMRTESVLRGDIATRAVDPDCVACDG